MYILCTTNSSPSAAEVTSIHVRLHIYTYSQAVGLRCSGAAKQQRHQRVCVNALLQRMKLIWRQGGRGARLSDTGRDQLCSQQPQEPTHSTAARRSRRDRSQAALMFIWTLTHGAYTARSSTYTHSDMCMYNFWAEELKIWDSRGSYGGKKILVSLGFWVFFFNLAV